MRVKELCGRDRDSELQKARDSLAWLQRLQLLLRRGVHLPFCLDDQ
uniref:Uncharacterized protein n=1 Tax=Arundo donax TaxID=35708 RepID=A0A0A9CJU0_ARUDO